MSKITEQEERWHSLEAFVAACESAAKITENSGGFNCTILDMNTFQDLLKEKGFSILPIKATLQNKVSDASSEDEYLKWLNEVIRFNEESIFGTGKDDIQVKLLKQVKDKYASIVNEKDNIPADFKRVTGHDSPKEMMAYEKGREDEQKVISEWIEQWDGSSNSAMGTLLKKKFDERKDNAGSWIKASERLPVNGGWYFIKAGVDKTVWPRKKLIARVNLLKREEAVCYLEWLEESQPQKKRKQVIQSK